MESLRPYANPSAFARPALPVVAATGAVQQQHYFSPMGWHGAC